MEKEEPIINKSGKNYTFAGKPREGSKLVSFMENLKLASFDPLNKLEGRGDCPKCNAKRKYFCYDCVVPLNKDKSEVPRLDLPVDVLIVRHPKEKRSKSSVIPSGIISPDNVEILHTIDIPDQTKEFGDDPDAVVLMFPSDQAVEVAKMSQEELLKIKKVILIDCTWSQTKHYLYQDYIKKVKHVKIKTEKTAFWRFQKGVTDEGLATIEALYFFFRDYETNLMHQGSYEKYSQLGKWDNILYYYAFNFQIIQNCYRDGKLKDQPFRRIPGYVKYEENNQSGAKKQDTISGQWIGETNVTLGEKKRQQKLQNKSQNTAKKEELQEKNKVQKSD